MSDNQKQLLLAFEGKNTRVPIWIMRQAGRYLPEYREIRKTRNFLEMIHAPEIASEITLQPIKRFQMDGAILFADILTLPHAIGFDVDFKPGVGPVINNPVHDDSIFNDLKDFTTLDFQAKTIELILKDLPSKSTLIGFAGTPFTVLTYLIEGGSSKSFTKTFSIMLQKERLFEKLINYLTDQTIQYLQFQKRCGIEVFQLFDSWGGLLSVELYERWILPSIKKIFKAIDLPSIYYIKGSRHLFDSVSQCGSDFISVCDHIQLDKDLPSNLNFGIQGNLFNGYLYAPDEILVEQVKIVLEKSKNFNRFIFNLSHGVFPDISPEKVKLIVKTVRDFSLSRS